MKRCAFDSANQIQLGSMSCDMSDLTRLNALAPLLSGDDQIFPLGINKMHLFVRVSIIIVLTCNISSEELVFRQNMEYIKSTIEISQIMHRIIFKAHAIKGMQNKMKYHNITGTKA